MDMNINPNVAGFRGASQPSRVSRQDQAPQPTPQQPSNSVDLTDGANNVIELAILPSVDYILGQAVSDGIQQGNTVHVDGQITTDNDTKRLASIKYEMKPNVTAGILDTKGALLADQENNIGTYIRERTQQDPNNMFSSNVTGTVSTNSQNQQTNENLKVSVGMGSFSTKGNVNGFDIEENMSLDPWSGSINQAGIIAGQQYQRKISPDFSTGGSNIQGKMGDMEEIGTVGLKDGAIFIDRKIGDYHIQEKITFSPFKEK